MLKEFVLEHKEDLWRIPEDTRVLRVKCSLNHHAAVKILESCRELEFMIFDANAYHLTSEGTKKYLSTWVFLDIEGELREHKIPEEKAREIRELYSRGDHNLYSLSLRFGLPQRVVWRIVKEKAHG